MKKNHYGQFGILAKFSEITVLALSFLLFALFSNNTDVNQVIFSAALYSTINLTFMCLSRAYLPKVTQSPIILFNQLTENLVGLIIGGIAAFHLINSLVQLDNVIMILIFSSIMTFFILGTFSPLMETTAKNVARR